MKSRDQYANLTREELYERVWKEPVDHLAKRFGISNVGLGKLCRRLNIPCPPRGYWARLRSGKPVIPKPPLPSLPAARTEEPVLVAMPREPTKDEHLNAFPGNLLQFIELHSAERFQCAAIDVLRNPDPATAYLRERLDSRRSDDRYGVVQAGTGSIHLRIASTNGPRVLRILDALLKWLRKRGFIDSSGSDAHSVRMIGETIGIRVDEPTVRMTPEEAEAANKKSKRHSFYTQQYRPTGQLTLKIDGWGRSVARKTWNDKPHKQLESVLPDIVESLLIIAVERRLATLERRRDEAIREDRHRDTVEEHRKQMVEEEVIKNLHKQASLWRTSEALRSFINAVSTLADSNEPPPGVADRISAWVSWARQRADSIDPLANGPAGFMEEMDRTVEEVKESAKRNAEEAIRRSRSTWS